MPAASVGGLARHTRAAGDAFSQFAPNRPRLSFRIRRSRNAERTLGLGFPLRARFAVNPEGQSPIWIPIRIPLALRATCRWPARARPTSALAAVRSRVVACGVGIAGSALTTAHDERPPACDP